MAPLFEVVIFYKKMNIKMNTYYYYQNGKNEGKIEADSPSGVILELDKKYGAKGLDWKNDLSVRIFQEIITKNNSSYHIELVKVSNSGKIIDKSAVAGKAWNIKLKYKEIEIDGHIYDNTDQTIYVLWESIARILKIDMDKEIEEIEFTVDLEKGKESQKNKLVLFFSKKGNYGKIWKYSDARKAMAKARLAMDGRGIEGERPREFRYSMGYDFRTNEKDKDIPDGSFIVGSPFPFGPRNERRIANVDLNKEDWSELLKILKENPKRLRCKICGLFEGETNCIGQKTKFQKGHFQSHLSGGNVSKANIFSICQYCNTDESNIYDIDPITGKKIWNFIPAINKRDYKTKIEIYGFLKKHLKKKDLDI